MKKLLSLFIALVMSFTLVFGTVACKKNNDSTSNSTTESSDAGSGSTTDDSSSGSQSSGGEVAKEIKVDYVHANFDASVKNPATTDTEEVTVDSVGGDIYVKFIGTEIEFAVDATVLIANPQNLKQTRTMDLDIVYAQSTVYAHFAATMLTGDAATDANAKTEEDTQVFYAGSLEDAFAYLTAMAEEESENASMIQGLAMDQVPAIIAAVKQTIAARGKVGQLGLKSYDTGVFDVKTQIVDRVLGFVEENKDEKLMTVIAKLTGDKDAAVLAEKIKKIFDESQGEATIADVVDRLVEFINSYGAGIDLKVLCDGIQAQTGVSTTEVVAFVKDMLKNEAGMTDEAIAAILPAVTDGQTLYDYVHAIADSYKVTDIIKMFTASKPVNPSPDPSTPDTPETQAEGDASEVTDEITFESVGTMAIEFLKGTTVAEAFGMVAGELTLADFLTAAKTVVEKLEVSSKLVVDANGYPTKIANKVSYLINLEAFGATTGAKMGEIIAATIDLDYAETVPADKAALFTIPADAEYPAYIKLLPYGLTKAQTEDALENGLEIEIVSAKGFDGWELYLNCNELTGEGKNAFYYGDKKVVYIENNKLVLTADFFKAIESEHKTFHVSFGMVRKNETDGNDYNTMYYSFSPISGNTDEGTVVVPNPEDPNPDVEEAA